MRRTRARETSNEYHDEDEFHSVDYDGDSPGASADEAEVRHQPADLKYEKECAMKALVVAKAQCKAAADEILRLREENAQLAMKCRAA